MSVFLRRRLQSNSRSAGSAGQTLPWTGQTRHPRSRLESPPLVEHELKMFNYRWAALRAGANLQHWEAKGNLNVSHLTAPLFRELQRAKLYSTRTLPFRCDATNMTQRLQRTKDCVSAHRSFVLQCVDD